MGTDDVVNTVAANLQADYMYLAKKVIDEIFGDGYAAAHPELIGAYMQSCATQDLAEELNKFSENLCQVIHNADENLCQAIHDADENASLADVSTSLDDVASAIKSHH